MTQSLRKLASAATPGPWEAWDGHDGTYAVEYGDREVLSPFLSEADANYIAAVNPSAILALLDEHEATIAAKDKRIAELEGTLEILRTDVLLLLGAVQAQDPNAELRLRCADILRRAANLTKEQENE